MTSTLRLNLPFSWLFRRLARRGAGPSERRRRAPLSPFLVRSFRFQWPADLLMSWAFEMESLILGWYVLVGTGSVFYLTLYGALQFVGTLVAPFSGVLGDRIGRRTTLCGTRAFLTTLACVVMTLAFAGVLKPVHVLPIAFFTGLVRPSDLVMRNSLIGDTMAPAILMNALALSRMTMDSARIMGALAGASLFAALGIGPAYAFVASFYAMSFLLTLGVSHVPAADAPDPSTAPPMGVLARQWRDLKDGLVYSWKEPAVVGLMLLAFLVNFSAFPFTTSLMPYVARNVYAVDATGLGHLVASFAGGALTGSLIMTVIGSERLSAKFMLVNVVLLYAIIGVFTHTVTKTTGMTVLFVMGIVHNLAMVSLSGVLLRGVAARFRARVMGIRMLVVYGLPLGLLLSGPLIARFGYSATGTAYVALGIVCTFLIGVRWRRALWATPS